MAEKPGETGRKNLTDWGIVCMASENAVKEAEEIFEDFNLDDLEERLQAQLEDKLRDISFLDEEKSKIGNPDAMGQVVLEEVWKQFANQVGLDMTNETLIQKYEREHPESYSEVGNAVMQDKRYKNANKQMKEDQQNDSLKDEYTGKNLGAGDKANLDHVVSRKEIYENKRRKQANIATENLANKDENLKATNESLNKSKNAKSVEQYTSEREKREADLHKQNEKANKKIDESNMSELEKQKAKEKNNKRLQDKLDADEELMKKADKNARKAINKDVTKGVIKETGKKAGKDALKMAAVQALFAMLKEIMNALVRFFKTKSKSFNGFLNEMKTAITNFIHKIGDFIQTGISSAVGTVVTEIFGPIVSMFRKLASVIKQGVVSLNEAVRYLTDKENKNKPFNIKVMQVGKIITSGIMAGGALFLGEVFEKMLMGISFMNIEIPLLGTLANILGMFLAALLCGIIGAIIINLIDKLIAKRQKQELAKEKLQKNNDILVIQEDLTGVAIQKTDKTKKESAQIISERHRKFSNLMKNSLNQIKENAESDFDDIDNDNDFDEIDNDLLTLLKD